MTAKTKHYLKQLSDNRYFCKTCRKLARINCFDNQPKERVLARGWVLMHKKSGRLPKSLDYELIIYPKKSRGEGFRKSFIEEVYKKYKVVRVKVVVDDSQVGNSRKDEVEE